MNSINAPITHIEVSDAKNLDCIKTGQLLKVIRETPCFIWVAAHNGTELQVSKRTKRINGSKTFFIRTGNQPIMNF